MFDNVGNSRKLLERGAQNAEETWKRDGTLKLGKGGVYCRSCAPVRACLSPLSIVLGRAPGGRSGCLAFLARAGCDSLCALGKGKALGGQEAHCLSLWVQFSHL